MVLPDSDWISRVRPYSGSRTERNSLICLTGCHPENQLSLAGFPGPLLRLTLSFVTPYVLSYNPNKQASLVWAVPVSLAATSTKGNRIFFLFLQVLQMFQFPVFSHRYPRFYEFTDAVIIPTDDLTYGVHPIRKSPDHCLITAPRAYRCSSRPSSAPEFQGIQMCRPFIT